MLPKLTAPPTPPISPTLRLSPHTLLALLSGTFASLASLSAKLVSSPTFLSTTSLPPQTIRLLSLSATILCNLLMWLTFTRALSKTPSTIEVTVLNSATNIALTGVCGWAVF
ncbi:hypothetical protein HK097_006333, partial [Rhizophlyctis rosea]